jgi:hypothetical protein
LSSDLGVSMTECLAASNVRPMARGYQAVGLGSGW